MTEFVLWMRATGLSEWVRTDPWLWPLLETLHFVGMCLLLGVIVTLDARLLGYLTRVPMSGIRRMLPWALAGFAINLVTGVLFFVGAPDQYVSNPAFYMKLLFLAVAGLNAAAFETRWGAAILETGIVGKTPVAFKVAGIISIVSWFMVLYWGRMLPFIGNAF